jgi:hypothetical protein
MAGARPDTVENSKVTRSWWSRGRQPWRGRGGAWSQHLRRGRLDERIRLGACGRANTSVGPLGAAAHQWEHPQA